MCQHASCLFWLAMRVRTSNVRSGAGETHFSTVLQPSCSAAASVAQICALWHTLLVAAGATALSLDRRVALRAAASQLRVSRPAKAVLACVDGQARGAADAATNERAQSRRRSR